MSDAIIPKQPYYLHGYTGHCPEVNQRIGSSYSALTHKILLDPLVRHSNKLVLADSEAADYELNQCGCGKPVGKHKVGETREMEGEDEPPFEPEFEEKLRFPIPPGYTGHLPGSNIALSISRTENAKETMAVIRNTAKIDSETRRELQRLTELQYRRRKPKNLDESLELQNEFALPLIDVRPEACGLIRNVFKDETFQPPATHNKPYFMEINDPEKYFISGYTGHVPYGFAKFGTTYVDGSRSGLKEFTRNYNRRKSTEWAPAGIIHAEPADVQLPHQIYSEKHGVIPKYAGFIPGFQFRCGKTFGEATRDAKKWLRADFSN